jgi:hypothetical protein
MIVVKLNRSSKRLERWTLLLLAATALLIVTWSTSVVEGEEGPVETFELSPDGRRSIESYPSLEAAIERAQALLPARPNVGRFHIYAMIGFGNGLVGPVSRDGGFRKE